LAPVIKTLRYKVRDRSESTKIGYKIPQNDAKAGWCPLATAGLGWLL